MEEEISTSGLVGNLPGVCKYIVTLEDIDGEGSTRTEDGVMHREVLRSNVVHVSVQHIVDPPGVEAIVNAIKTNPDLDGVELYLPGIASSSNHFYCSKLTTELIVKTATNERWLVSYELVEV